MASGSQRGRGYRLWKTPLDDVSRRLKGNKSFEHSSLKSASSSFTSVAFAAYGEKRVRVARDREGHTSVVVNVSLAKMRIMRLRCAVERVAGEVVALMPDMRPVKLFRGVPRMILSERSKRGPVQCDVDSWTSKAVRWLYLYVRSETVCRLM